jgi:signal transduction histidine kinase/CheY-like chemotaxis protein
MTVHRAVLFGKMWRDPQASLVGTSRQIYDFCIAENDLVGAANAILNEALWTWRSAPTLEEVAATLEETDARAERLGDARSRAEIAFLADLVRRLRQPEPLSLRPAEEVVPGKIEDARLEAMDDLCLSENWPAIVRVARESRANRSALDSHLVGVNWRFYENLARLRTGLAADRADLKLIERVARTNPTDHLGKLLLLRAEHAYRHGSDDCLRIYGEALDAMQKGSSRLEAGVAAEAAAAAAFGLGDRAAQERFRAAAAAIWSGWGAFAKLAAYKAEPLDPSIRTQLAEAEAQAALARRSEQAKSRFLAEVGHELRTPLQAMQGLLDLAAERPEELNLGAIRDVFGSLKSVVDDLTELGALGAQAPLNVRTVDLPSLLESELGLVQEAARKKKLVLRADLGALQETFFAIDGDRVRQVVRNLLSNAVKYSDSGTIVLSARTSDGTDGRARIALIVEDSGPGIPEARLAHLFEPFDRAGRDDSLGLGLGLSLSRRIAERMGGSLTAENRGEGGARFVFSFVAEPRDGPGRTQAVPRPLTILVVEDTAPVRRLLARLLTLDGHVAIEAETLAEALEHATDNRFDLVLLDLNLPDGDGLSLLERWSTRRERLPVIVLTASVSSEVRERVASAGAALLHKPFASADLRAAIAEACGTVPPRTQASFDAEMAKLARDAREEIAARAAELAELAGTDLPLPQLGQLAHKLAGLAAQFDAPGVAEAADRIEQACAAGLSLRPGLESLSRALAKTARPQSAPDQPLRA